MPRDWINRDWENRPEGGGVEGTPAAFGEGQALPTPQYWTSDLQSGPCCFKAPSLLYFCYSSQRKKRMWVSGLSSMKYLRCIDQDKNMSLMFTHLISLEGLRKFLSWDSYGMMLHISILDVFIYNYKGAALLTNDPSILIHLGLKGYQTETGPSLCRAQ